MIFKDKLQVVEAGYGGEDAHGNPIYDWDNPEVVDSIPAHVDYQNITESTENGDTLWHKAEIVAYVKREFAAVDGQRLLWRGDRYEVDGPFQIRSAQGRTHHLEVTLKRYTGWDG